VCEVYGFRLTLRAPCSEKSTEGPSEGGFEGIEKVFAAVGLGGGAQPPPARRDILSQDLLPIRAPSSGTRGQHIIHGLASLRLLACHCDTIKQGDVNSRIV
jgi:hypothetical protein